MVAKADNLPIGVAQVFRNAVHTASFGQVSGKDAKNVGAILTQGAAGFGLAGTLAALGGGLTLPAILGISAFRDLIDKLVKEGFFPSIDAALDELMGWKLISEDDYKKIKAAWDTARDGKVDYSKSALAEAYGLYKKPVATK
ncbi:MAG: hypothetical protein FWD15_05720 [Alphaproteobacteria bacterium]|nr:hypothetical protein [Alphaproteobacteria bacterium]